MSEISLKGLNKAEVLAELYNNSIPLGLGMLHYTPEKMSVEEAEALLSEFTYFDYLKGRVMKVDLSRDILNTSLYNRDNGENAAENIISAIKKKV